MFPNIRADLAAHKGNWGAQGFWAMVIYRFGRWRYTLGNRWVRMPFSLVYKVAFKGVQVCTGIELPCEVIVGQGFRIDHFGGIVISGFASFGDHCVIRNGVTVGLRRLHEPSAPTIGNHVDIGAGAKVLGPITVGDHAVIGANAVVIADVPPRAIAVGVPARIIYPPPPETP